ncbi:hypothetical protein ABZ912_48095 [Nonomuraea angiospora]|uniref:hypothetical protein n=1 Tax=Nonomuraea angiospora TaxID=46172 RepID=UPI0033F4156E
MLILLAGGLVALGPEIYRLAGNPASETSASPVASPSVSKTASVAPIKVAPLKKLKPPQLFALSPNPITGTTLKKIKRLKGVVSLESVGAATVEFNGRRLQALAVNPSTFRAYTSKVTAESDVVWQRIAEGGLAISFSTDINGAQPGDRIMSGARSMYIAAQADTGLRVVDVILSLEVGKALGVPEKNALLVHAPTTDSVELREAILKILPTSSQVALVSMH